jgi:hypothetical protein
VAMLILSIITTLKAMRLERVPKKPCYEEVVMCVGGRDILP